MKQDSGTTFFKVDPSSGNHQTPLEGLKYVGATLEDLTKEFNDVLISNIARISGTRFIRYSLGSDVYYHVIRPGVRMAGLVEEVIENKVMYWAEYIDETYSLVYLKTPSKDSSDWVKEECLLSKLLPLARPGGGENTAIIEKVLRAAPEDVVIRYLKWAEGFYGSYYPNVLETLAKFEAGL